MAESNEKEIVDAKKERSKGIKTIMDTMLKDQFSKSKKVKRCPKCRRIIKRKTSTLTPEKEKTEEKNHTTGEYICKCLYDVDQEECYTDPEDADNTDGTDDDYGDETMHQALLDDWMKY